MNQDERRLYLIRNLLAERPEYQGITIPETPSEQAALYRSLVNVRPPSPLSEEFLEIQDTYLKTELSSDAVSLADLSEVASNLFLWRGDITRLSVDGIVNAANSQLLGCFYPNHRCIDNAIHTFAGMQLRQACYELMQEQGRLEETGCAKITPAYNLPSSYVLHTVGPIVTGSLTDKHCEDLKKCYESCLTLADENGLESIAFCCISTGEFHFPNQAAAGIAVETVRNYLEKTKSHLKVVFNVFKEEDQVIYEGLLKKDTAN